jgi:hypothetical protein
MPRDDNEERREVSPEGVESSPGAPDEVAPTGAQPTAEGGPGPAAEAPLGFNLRRRGYLAAAALGSAAAALVGRGDGPRFGAMEAFADDLSQFQCTANDVRIVGLGRITNEPCTCTGPTFQATVEFTVENNANSARNCITVHLCPVTVNGVPIPQQDVILQGEIAGKTTRTMTGTLTFPCGGGLVCFGAEGQDDRGRCDAGVCCTTVSWGVPGQDTCPPDRVITSKCRHQRICILGRGVTTLDCDTGTAGVQTNCAVQCGGTATLRLCTTSDAALGPFTFTLGAQSFGPTADRCHDFTVGPITAATTTFTGTVTDNEGCAKSASVTLTTTPVAAPQLSGALNAGCTGAATFTVANCDPTITYTYQEVNCTTGAPIGSSQGGLGVCSATFTFAPGAADATHCVRVTASNGSSACDQTAQASVVIPATVTATLAIQGAPDCTGVVTLLATAGGGVAPHTFQFNGATGTVSGSGTTRTIILQPVLTQPPTCRSVTVTVTDARGCAATSSAVSYSQCVTTTTPC